MDKQALRFATDVIEAIRDNKVVSAGIETTFAEAGGKVTGYGDELIYTFVIQNPQETPSTD